MKVDYYKQEIEDIDKMIVYLREHKKNMQRMDKLRFRECHTPKQFGKREADMNWLAMENTKLKHNIHALAVDLEYADMREEYNDIELNPDGWHCYKFKMPTPRDFLNKESKS